MKAATNQLRLQFEQTSALIAAEDRSLPSAPIGVLQPVDESFATMTSFQSRQSATLAPRPDRRRTEREIIAQQWEGTVDRIEGSVFFATLRSLRTPGEAEKEAEIPLEQVTRDDLELLEPGAIFYWTIGYDISPAGTRRNSSYIVFRRLPAWTRKDMQRIQEGAKHLFDAFGIKGDEPRHARG